MKAAGGVGAGYALGGNVPSFGEEVAPDEHNFYATVAGYATSCTHYTSTVDNQAVSATVSAVSFPQLGVRSVARSEAITVEGLTLSKIDVVVEAHGVVAILEYGNVGTLDTAQAVHLDREAVAKL